MRRTSRGGRLLATVKRRMPNVIKRPLRAMLRRGNRLSSTTAYAVGRSPSTRTLAEGTGIEDGRLRIVAESVAEARAAVIGAELSQPVTAVDVTILKWRRPHTGWSGRLGPVAGLVSHSAQLPKGRVGRAVVTAEVASPVPAQDLLDAALAALEPAHSLPATLTAAMLVVDGPRPPWLVASPVPVDGSAPPPEDPGKPANPLAPADVRLMREPATDGVDGVAPYSRYGLAGHVLIDSSYDNPIRRANGGHALPRATLTLDALRDGTVAWRVKNGSALVVAGRAGDPLNDAQRAALLGLGVLAHGAPTAGIQAAPHAAVLAQLAATGVVIEAPDLPAETRALLDPELAAVIGGPVLASGIDPLEWDIRSVVQRRAAIRGHDAGLVATPARTTSALPTVTALVVSRRPHLVRQVMAYLAAQTYPRLDVVVAMHGVAADAQTRAELAELPVPVEVLTLPEDISLGEALSEATLRARGSLVTKVDDDDQYGPEHIWDLVLAKRFSGATVVGKGPEFVYLTAHNLTIHRKFISEDFSDVVTGGTILISRGDLEAVGGWRPVPRSVDRALLDRVQRAGGLIYRTHAFGFIYTRHEEGHTWDPGGGTEYFLQNATRQWEGIPDELLNPRIR